MVNSNKSAVRELYHIDRWAVPPATGGSHFTDDVANGGSITQMGRNRTLAKTYSTLGNRNVLLAGIWSRTCSSVCTRHIRRSRLRNKRFGTFGVWLYGT